MDFTSIFIYLPKMLKIVIVFLAQEIPHPHSEPQLSVVGGGKRGERKKLSRCEFRY